MKRIKQLQVSTPQGESGQLTRDARYVFNYTTPERTCETSLLMPLRAESYAAGTMPGPFTMNLPEGYLKNKIEERLAKFGGVDDMKLLAFTGNNQIGRLRFQEPETQQTDRKAQMGRSELLKKSSSSALFAFLLDAYLESGISGVQPKVMIPDADKLGECATLVHSDLIVKASGEDYPHLAVNEFLCMTAAQKAGLQVPGFWLSDDGGLFVMERFDLHQGQQLGFEDMAVLMNKTSKKDEKYQSSYEAIAKAIHVYCDDDNRIDSLNRLFEYVTLSVMVRNGDAHLKNFGLLYDHPASGNGPKLSPLYDVVTTSAYDIVSSRGVQVDRSMALKMHGARDYPKRKELLEFGQVCSVKNPEQVLERIADAMQATLQQHSDRVEDAFLIRMKTEWDASRLALEPSHMIKTRYASKQPAATNETEIQK